MMARNGGGAGEGGGRGRPTPAGGGPEDGAVPCRWDAFSLPEDLHYLNCAYMSPLPKVTEAAVVEGLRRKRDPSGIGPADFFRDLEEVRVLFGGLVGGDPERVAVLPSASYGIGVCARNLPVERGQRVVLSHEQFPGNLYAWRRLASERGATVVTAGPEGIEGIEGGGSGGGGIPERGMRHEGGSAGAGGATGGGSRGARWNRNLLDAIVPGTAVVALPHVHWTDGTRFDLEVVTARAREVGAAVVIDATQSLGALPLDVGRVPVDAVVAATYKWLLGPYGMALAWFGPRLDGGVPLEETWMARAGSRDFQRLVDYRDEYQPGARRYDVGEAANFALLPGVKASLQLVGRWGPQAVQAYDANLTRELVEVALERGFHVEEPRWRAHHLFGIRMRGDVALDRLKEELDRRRIVVSLRGSALRVSPNLYNRREDVAALVDVLRKV